MTCCIVGLFILAVVGRVRRAFGAVETPMVFAPVAQRPAPGQSLPQPMSVAADPSPAGAAVFRYAAAGVALCLTAAPLLVWLGVLENTGSTTTWLLRGVCYLLLIGLAVVLSRSVGLLRGFRGPGWLLVVLGAVIFESGVADMHLFRVIEVDHGNIVGDMVFHNVGPLIAVIGAVVLLYGAAGRRSTSSRSSRSTVTSARPSSSAVTVSSTPPVTT
ncbi:MAG: hypothetical protein WCP30_06135 [Mycobacteriaceae bacterium]